MSCSIKVESVYLSFLIIFLCTFRYRSHSMSPNHRGLRFPGCSQPFPVARWHAIDCESIILKKESPKKSCCIWFFCFVSAAAPDHRLLYSSLFSYLTAFPSMSLQLLQGKTKQINFKSGLTLVSELTRPRNERYAPGSTYTFTSHCCPGGVFFARYCARVLPVFSVNTGLYFLGRTISPFVSVLQMLSC